MEIILIYIKFWVLQFYLNDFYTAGRSVVFEIICASSN